MYKLGVTILTIIWVMDILNFPCMAFLDTTIPINFLGWFLIWLFIPKANDINIEIKKRIKEVIICHLKN